MIDYHIRSDIKKKDICRLDYSLGKCKNFPNGRCLLAYPKTVRLNTMYEDEKSNYYIGCDFTIEKINDYYDEL